MVGLQMKDGVLASILLNDTVIPLEGYSIGKSVFGVQRGH